MTVLRISSAALVLAACGLGGCFGSDDSASSEGAAQASSKASSKVEACLRKAMPEPCTLLQNAGAEGLYPDDLTFAPQEYGGQVSCTASWSAGREQEIKAGAMTFSGPVDDTVELNGIRELSDDLERASNMFAAQHRTRSDEEKARLAETAAEAARKEVGDQHKDMATDLASKFVNAIEYEAIDGVGDAAAWGGVGRFKQLAVRAGRMAFQVRMTRSNEEPQVIADSVQLAKAVIEGCQ